ncbi:transposase [Clostridium estertheticum]|nr:transposase [Clostridium estertheticum]
MIKEIFQQTDEELIGSLHFDIRYQYALYTTAYEKQPVSINTLTNFRNRVIEYDLKPNIYSDSKFSDDVIKAISEKKKSDEKIQMITMNKQNIELIPGELVGRKPSTDKLDYSKFAVDKGKNAQ